jgi:hypothetical protein
MFKYGLMAFLGEVKNMKIVEDLNSRELLKIVSLPGLTFRHIDKDPLCEDEFKKFCQIYRVDLDGTLATVKAPITLVHYYDCMEAYVGDENKPLYCLLLRCRPALKPSLTTLFRVGAPINLKDLKGTLISHILDTMMRPWWYRFEEHNI